MDDQHVIIDGFNIIFGDKRLRKQFRSSQDLAKKTLVDMAQVIHDTDGRQVSVVFDGRGDEITFEYPVRNSSFTVIHSSSSVSADGVIERMLARSQRTDRIIVISNDNLVQNATRACGGESMRAEGFFDWVKSCEKRSRIDLTCRQLNTEIEWNNRLPL